MVEDSAAAAPAAQPPAAWMDLVVVDLEVVVVEGSARAARSARQVAWVELVASSGLATWHHHRAARAVRPTVMPHQLAPLRH